MRSRKILLVMGMVVLTAWVAPLYVHADGEPPDDDSEEPNEAEIELIYSVNRIPERTFDTGRSVQVITRDQIWRKNARTLGEVLIEEAGVFIQQTDWEYGNPIIRGLTGKQILILVDGVRFNNATFRHGPLQYLNTIDLHLVERIEVVKGVVSVFGSDALGGAINIITKRGRPGLGKDEFGGEAFARYSTADKAITGHAEAYGQTDSLRYQVGATYRESDDVEGGGDIGTQSWTGYDESAANLGLDYFFSEDRTLSFSYQWLEQDEVPRTDRYLSGTNLLFYFEPQRLQLARLTYEDLTDRGWYDKLHIGLSWNQQDEGRQEIRANKPGTMRLLDDSQTAIGLTLGLVSFVGTHQLVYGLDFYTEDISSKRDDLDLATGESSPKRGRYTDGASYETTALYLQDRFDPAQWVTVTAGLRLLYYSVGGSEDSDVGELDLEATDTDYSATLGGVFHVSEDVNLVANITRGYRSPNIDDISSFDMRPEGIEVPNPDLSAEVVMSYEVGIKYDSPKLSGSAFYYLSDLNDLMERAPGTFNGESFFDENGNGVQDDGEVPFVRRENIGEAEVRGIELDLRWRPHPNLCVFGNYAWTEGNNTVADEPLSKIPPSFGAVGLRWSAEAKLEPWAEVVVLYASAQRDLSPGDITDIRIGPDGTDGFTVLNLRGGLSVGERFRAVAALENAFDEQYKHHGSGVWRPGRQFVLGGELKF